MTNHRPAIRQKPVAYHPCLDDTFDCWAAECGYEPLELRRVTEHAVRTRHREALITDETRKPRGRQPAVWELDLGRVRVIYTVERHAVVIRGYCWDIPSPPRDDFDGGGYFPEFDWHLPGRSSRPA